MNTIKDIFLKELGEMSALVTDDKDQWLVKGFIDARKNIYELSVDTKVISKVIEWMILPLIYKIAQKREFQIEISEHQNYYPDVTVIDETNKKYAIDFKSSYRVDEEK